MNSMKLSDCPTNTFFEFDGDYFKKGALLSPSKDVKDGIGDGPEWFVSCYQIDPMHYDLVFFPNRVWIGTETIVELIETI